jgi:ribosomal protein S27AE
MEAAVTNEINEVNEVFDIHYDNATFKAAVCHRCGAKMFPAELLEAHMDRHQLKDMFLDLAGYRRQPVFPGAGVDSPPRFTFAVSPQGVPDKGTPFL